jgi:hypothetical protein
MINATLGPTTNRSEAECGPSVLLTLLAGPVTQVMSAEFPSALDFCKEDAPMRSEKSELSEKICAQLISGTLTSNELSFALDEPESFVIFALANLQNEGFVKLMFGGQWSLANEFQVGKLRV